MNNIDTNNSGTMPQMGNIMRVNNALVEEVFSNDRNTGYILISYELEDQNNRIHIQLLRLNVGLHTIILDQFGQNLYLRDIREGMWVDAEFSTAMTRSIPPQSSAFRIIVRTQSSSIDNPSMNVTTDRVAIVDINNSFLYTGDINNMNDQMRFVISNATVILDQNGNQIGLYSIHPGQLVRVEHANFQTLSIPPQTTAFRVQLL